MTLPRPATGPASNSGVRRGGDRFQDLFVWDAAMQVIRPGSQYTQVEVEINGVGNVDDVVLRNAAGGGDLYGQVKWATNPADLLDAGYLMARKGNGKSLLQKLYASWTKLNGNGAAPTLQLITNRGLDRDDPLLGHVDGRSDLLVPYAADAGPTSEAGKALQEWADHVGATRDELLAMLHRLQFVTGRAITAEQAGVIKSMALAGLDPTEEALERGLSIVGRWVVDGKRVVTASDIQDAVDHHGLRRVEPSALLVVQAIDADTHPEEATVALDWVHLYDVNQPPRLRVQPLDPAGWKQMDRDISQAAATLENAGWRATLVRGALRQATFFRVGTALPTVRQHTLRYFQFDELWSTDAPKTPIAPPQTQRTELGLGPDLAIAAGVALDPTEEVVAHLRRAALPVEHLVTITPAAGAEDQAVDGAGEAVSYAEQIRNLVRAELIRRPDAERIHLFLAAPGGLALLLGHRWNRTRETAVYEHLGVGRGYTAAFTIGA
jgi:hypothetical protein